MMAGFHVRHLAASKAAACMYCEAEIERLQARLALAERALRVAAKRQHAYASHDPPCDDDDCFGCRMIAALAAIRSVP